jgi:hypothetical protein
MTKVILLLIVLRPKSLPLIVLPRCNNEGEMVHNQENLLTFEFTRRNRSFLVFTGRNRFSSDTG